jgi:prevent-host-death family protein
MEEKARRKPMITVPSTQFQMKTGEYLEKCRKEPVEISYQGKPKFVLLSVDEYQKMEKAGDLYWLMLAKEATKDGHYIEGEEFLRKTLKDIEDRD